MHKIPYNNGDWKVLNERDKCNNRNHIKDFMKRRFGVVIEIEDCSKYKVKR